MTADTSDPLQWRSLTEEEREREYSPSSCIGGDYMPYINAYIQRSAAAHAGHAPVTVQYGSKPSQTIDLFVPENASIPVPVLVFIHGGYWQELSKKESAFAAPACMAHGFAYAAVDYTLAPTATVADIVAECRAAVHWLAENGADHGLDPSAIVVAGSSAGGHLAAMVSATATLQNNLKGAVLVSGVFDLEPLIGTSINEALSLTTETAKASSPILADVSGFPDTIVCWGENETDQFKRQSNLFVDLLVAASHEGGSIAVSLFECAGRNHFDVILDLTDSDTRLGQETLALLGSTDNHS